MRTVVLRGESSRQQIVADTGLSKATVSRLVRHLVDDGRIVEGPLVNGSAFGRSTQTLGFKGADDLVCGIDIGGTSTRFILADHRARLKSAWRTPTAHGGTSKDLARWIADQVTEACADQRRPLPTFTLVGVPGVVQPGTGRIRHAPNLRAIEGDRFRRQLEAGFEGTFVVENDSNLALVGELCAGAAIGADVAVMVTIGTGVGAGVALHGRLLTGATGLVGEIGMLPVALDGTVLEDVISGTAIARAAEELGLEDRRPVAVIGRDVPGPQHRLRARVLDALFAGCMACAVAYEPEVIVIGGGVSRSLGAVLPSLQQRLGDALESPPRLRISHLGDPAGALGAVAIALEAAYRQLGAVVDAGVDAEFRRSMAVLAAALEDPPDPPGGRAIVGRRRPPSSRRSGRTQCGADGAVGQRDDER
jgi:predicted NBD/HSP70 family sugar kinase